MGVWLSIFCAEGCGEGVCVYAMGVLRVMFVCHGGSESNVCMPWGRGVWEDVSICLFQTSSFFFFFYDRNRRRDHHRSSFDCVRSLSSFYFCFIGGSGSGFGLRRARVAFSGVLGWASFFLCFSSAENGKSNAGGRKTKQKCKKKNKTDHSGTTNNY